MEKRLYKYGNDIIRRVALNIILPEIVLPPYSDAIE